jgi:hypothetical protein
VEGQADGASRGLALLAQRAERGLEQASTDRDCQGIADAVALFEQVVDRARREDDPNYPVALINLANGLLVQAEECNCDASLDEVLHLINRHGHLFADHPLRLAYMGRHRRTLLMTGAAGLLEATARLGLNVVLATSAKDDEVA